MITCVQIYIIIFFSDQPGVLMQLIENTVFKKVLYKLPRHSLVKRVHCTGSHVWHGKGNNCISDLICSRQVACAKFKAIMNWSMSRIYAQNIWTCHCVIVHSNLILIKPAHLGPNGQCFYPWNWLETRQGVRNSYSFCFIYIWQSEVWHIHSCKKCEIKHQQHFGPKHWHQKCGIHDISKFATPLKLFFCKRITQCLFVTTARKLQWTPC